MRTFCSLKRSGRKRKFTEANKTLETFIAKYPKHELLSTAKMAMAANLDSMGKTDEALAMYQQIASAYPNGYAAPLAMLSQVYILKAKNRNDDARRICETILTQYRTSFWAGEAMQQLRLLKPITTSTPPPAAGPTSRRCWLLPRQRRKLRPRRTSRRARHRQKSRRRRCSHRPVAGFRARVSRKRADRGYRALTQLLNVWRTGNASARRVARIFFALSCADRDAASPRI